jgi:hypothetical protein
VEVIGEGEGVPPTTTTANPMAKMANGAMPMPILANEERKAAKEEEEEARQVLFKQKGTHGTQSTIHT